MSGLTIPIGLLDTTIAIITGLIFTLIGIIYRKLRSRIDTLEKRVSELEDNNEALMSWAFGSELDTVDGGVAHEIDEGFKQLTERLESIESSMEEQHKKTEEQLNKLVYELDSEEAVGIEREDIYDD
jgi:chaperonin cofactor prefoldin